MKKLSTATGSPFQYKEHPDGELIVYASDQHGNLQEKSAIVITPYIIRLVKRAIQRHGRIMVGASRDNPPPQSLGVLIKAEHQSPQQLSYLIPILAEAGECEILREGQAIVAKSVDRGRAR